MGAPKKEMPEGHFSLRDFAKKFRVYGDDMVDELVGKLYANIFDDYTAGRKIPANTLEMARRFAEEFGAESSFAVKCARAIEDAHREDLAEMGYVFR